MTERLILALRLLTLSVPYSQFAAFPLFPAISHEGEEFAIGISTASFSKFQKPKRKASEMSIAIDTDSATPHEQHPIVELGGGPHGFL